MNQPASTVHKSSAAGFMLGVALVLSPWGSAHAYVGPGLGLGTVMIILGFLGSLLLAVIGIFWYPIKRVLKKRKAATQDDPAKTLDENVQPEEPEAS